MTTAIHPGEGLIDFEELERTVERAEEGDLRYTDLARHELLELCRRRTRWQYIIHGDTEQFRAGTVAHLCEEGKFKKAQRYACCGRGDTAYCEENGPRVKMRPRCCGYRICPRCSRRYGRKILRKVGKHLARAPHGAIDHIVLTQRVIDGEALDVTRERFEKKWKRVYKAFRACGMQSMLVTYHVKRTRGEGWHYHAHCVLEWKGAIDAEDSCLAVDREWRKTVERAGEPSHPVFYRHVAKPGEALGELEADGQGEFWRESGDPVTQLLQYCIRDVVQGIENWVEGVDTDQLTGEFARAVDGAKLHRLYGEWRKRVDDEDEEEEEPDPKPEATDEEKQKAALNGEQEQWLKLGSMDSVLKAAENGVTTMVEFLQTLECTFFNRSAVCRRFTAALRSIGV